MRKSVIFSARLDPLFMRARSKWRKARARCLLQSAVSVDHERRPKVVGDRENKRQHGGGTAKRCPRTGPTCLLRLALLQSAAGDVLARVHLDVRHPLRRSRRWSSWGNCSGDFSPPVTSLRVKHSASTSRARARCANVVTRSVDFHTYYAR